MTANTSLVRECLELILMLADALERKKAGPAIQNSHPVTPQVAPAGLLVRTAWKHFATDAILQAIWRYWPKGLAVVIVSSTDHGGGKRRGGSGIFQTL